MKTPGSGERESVFAWVNLQQAQRVVQALVEERLQAATGLSWPEFELLWRLQAATDEPLQMSDIAEQLIGSPSGITRMADRLEAGGLIVRHTPPDNRRVVHARLTARGTTVVERSRRAFGEALDEAFSTHLSDADVAALRRLMRRLLEGNGAWVESRCDPKFGASGPAKAPAEPARGGRRRY
ncbi:MAG TPA: MarR family transcriptional regulator [Candidatus Dormibacteraeota bacterium]|nr:MarR family transcriptional regulator [Candidatus Dormibacteraeota bacterium]